MADTDEPHTDPDTAATDGVLGNLPATRPGRRSTRRTGGAGSGDGSTPADAATSRPRRASTAPAKGTTARAGTARAAGRATAADAPRTKPAGATKATAKRRTAASATPATSGATSAKRERAPAGSTASGRPKAAGEPAGTAADASTAGGPTRRGVRRAAAPDQPPVPPAPRSGWATPEREDSPAPDLSIGGLVGGAAKQGEKLVRGVFRRIGRG